MSKSRDMFTHIVNRCTCMYMLKYASIKKTFNKKHVTVMWQKIYLKLNINNGYDMVKK